MVLDDGLHLSPALTMPHTKAGNVGGCHRCYNYDFFKYRIMVGGEVFKTKFQS